jgi:methylmalonyl-CoA mutase C-terminal domain/subunit
MGMMKDEDLEKVLVVVGGVIPNKDIPLLKEMGVAEIFPGGSRFDDIAEFIQQSVKH